MPKTLHCCLPTTTYKDEEIINIEEWLKSQKVIIDGVVNGVITTNGTGRQEFANFDEAKKVFPTLELSRRSKDFMLSDDNDPYGPLYYLTMAAAENYYGDEIPSH